jgi:hypothetical protein
LAQRSEPLAALASRKAPEQLIPVGGVDELHIALKPVCAFTAVGETQSHPRRRAVVAKNTKLNTRELMTFIVSPHNP